MVLGYRNLMSTIVLGYRNVLWHMVNEKAKERPFSELALQSIIHSVLCMLLNHSQVFNNLLWKNPNKSLAPGADIKHWRKKRWHLFSYHPWDTTDIYQPMPMIYLCPWAAAWLKQFMSSWSDEEIPLASSILRRGSAPRLSSKLTSS